jgi:WD repeat-containing protein 45
MEKKHKFSKSEKMEMKEKKGKTRILHLSVHQNEGLFAVGTNKGFKIYQYAPFLLKYSKSTSKLINYLLICLEMDGGVGLIQMLVNSTLIAIVGGGKNPSFTQNKVILWDLAKDSPAAELEFKSPIHNVKLKRNL